jgi:soluble lytic murein transglycosylase-like protein
MSQRLRAAENAVAAESPIEKQKKSIATMEESIARQRASVRLQAGAGQADGFFTLPPPTHSAGSQYSPHVAAPPSCDPLSDNEVNTLVQDASKKESVDPDLIRSVMRQESAFRPCAISPMGAEGLMQLMPDTARQFNVTDPFDSPGNVNAGAKLLKQLLERYKGDVASALGAYNSGLARVDAAGGVPDIPETINYVKQIMGSLSNSEGTTGSPLSPDNASHWMDPSQTMLNILSH